MDVTNNAIENFFGTGLTTTVTVDNKIKNPIVCVLKQNIVTIVMIDFISTSLYCNMEIGALDFCDKIDIFSIIADDALTPCVARTLAPWYYLCIIGKFLHELLTAITHYGISKYVFVNPVTVNSVTKANVTMLTNRVARLIQSKTHCHVTSYHWPLLLTWFNFNPSVDK